MGLSKEISFESAMILKVNGFDLQTKYNYDLSGEIHNVGLQNHNINPLKISAPTVAQVVDWLYEKHGIWIGVELTDNTLSFYFQPTIWTTNDRDYHDEDMTDQAKRICKWEEWQFDSRTEAYEFAINYCLTNLI